MRASRGGWQAHAHVDAQQQAPTLDLILQYGSDLARVFAELGLVASTPEQALQLLRENAGVFAEHGVQVGDLRLDPLRIQGGLDVSWRGAGARQARFGVRVLADDARDVNRRRRSHMGTLYGAWRFFGRTELELGYTRWMTEQYGVAHDRGSFQVGVRTAFSDVHLPGQGRAIRGRVVESNASGTPGRPLADVEVVLDNGRTVRTDANGRYEFASPGRGNHRVSALLPSRAGAYFTAPSSVMLSAGGEVDFSIAFAGARLAGVVLDDGGMPIAGVTVRLEGAAELTATTDSSGAYVFNSPAGAGRVSLVADSIPAGYDISALVAQQRALAADAPATADFSLRAQRSLQGTVKGGKNAKPVITVLETGRHVEVDGAGRFLLRSLAAGRFTLLVRTANGEQRQPVVMPAEPGVVKVEVLAP